MLVGDTATEPLGSLAPLQPPEAVHWVALVLDHVRVELLPDAVLAGLAVRVTVGSGAVTGTGAATGTVTTVREVGSQAEMAPAASNAQTLNT